MTLKSTLDVPGKLAASTKPARRLHAPVILLIAFIARLGTFYFQISTLRDYCQQRTEMVATAITLSTGHGFSSPFFSPSGPTAFLTPGYPLIIAAIFGVFGTGAAGAAVILSLQLLFALLTIWCVMRVTAACFGEEAGNLAGLIGALFFQLWRVPLLLWDTALSSLLLIGMIALALRRDRDWGIMAGVCAIAGFVNPALLPALFFMYGAAAWRNRRALVLGLLLFLLIFSAWPLRNLVRMHAFIPLRSNFGYELWMGNHPGGDGDFMPALHPQSNVVERNRFVSEGELAFMSEKQRVAKQFISQNPGTFLTLTLRRVYRFWMGTADGAPAASAPLVFGAAAGIALLRKRRYLLWVLGSPLLIFPLPYYVTHADVRFQYILDPVLIVLAAFALQSLLRYLQGESGEFAAGSGKSSLPNGTRGINHLSDGGLSS